MTTPQTLRHVHTIEGPPISAWVRAWLHRALAILALLLELAHRAVGTVAEARSTVLVAGSLLCVPIALIGLAGVWWAILACCPIGLLIELLSRDEPTS
jgi:hypothetical protein